MRINNMCVVGKMFRNISTDSIRSGRTCPANFSWHVQQGMASLVLCPFYFCLILQLKTRFIYFRSVCRTHCAMLPPSYQQSCFSVNQFTANLAKKSTKKVSSLHLQDFLSLAITQNGKKISKCVLKTSSD